MSKKLVMALLLVLAATTVVGSVQFAGACGMAEPHANPC